MEDHDNFRALAENANDGILVATGQGEHVYANKRAAEIMGFSVQEILETRMQDLVHPAELKKIEKRLRERVEGKPVPRRYETAARRKDGKKVPVEITGAKTSWHGQSADIVIIRDIEDRKRSEERLRERERKFGKLLKSIRDGVYTLDSDGRFTFVNDVIVKRSSQTREWFLGRSYLGVIRPEDRDRVHENFKAVMRGGMFQSMNWPTPRHPETNSGWRSIPLPFGTVLASSGCSGFHGISATESWQRNASKGPMRN